MYRRLAFAAAAAAVTAACTIEPTPREYIDRQLPAAEVRELAVAELRDRIAILVQALEAGDAEAARTVLNPGAKAIIIGPGDGESVRGTAEIEAVLELVAELRPVSLELRDVRVGVNPRATVGWFAASIAATPPGAERVPMRMTGVFMVRDGEWELQLAHVSAPGTSLTAPAAAPAPAEAG